MYEIIIDKVIWMYTVFHLGLAHHAWTNEILGLTVGGTNVEAPFLSTGD